MQTKGQFPLLIKAEAMAFQKMERKKMKSVLLLFS